MLFILIHLTILIATAFLVLYIYLRKQYTFWQKRNIPFDPPTFIFGNTKDATQKGINHMIRNMYEKFKNERFFGIWFFHKPSLVINDLDIVKDVLVKEFMSFHDHGVYHDEKVDPLSANLFAIEGTKWRNMRIKMTPTFTSGKMKMMFPTMKQCSDQLKDVLTELAESVGVIDVKDVIGRFATDIIASVAFGIETNSLKNPNTTFRAMGSKIFEPTWSNFLRNFLMFTAPDIAKLLKIRPTPKRIADFFITSMKETIEYREKNNIQRNDFLQLLIQLMNKGYVEDADSDDKTVDRQKFTFEEAVPEAFIFFLGGFETSSTAMQFILYELAINQGIQDRVRQEIQDGLDDANGEMTYRNIHEMEYMGRVIEETLRKYPPASFLTRICTKPYKIPGTDIVLEKGTSITIPTFGFHMDEKYFPDPETFDPERFTEEQKMSRNHYAYLPFGEGPRVCIGQRFALMQIRIALATVLANFHVDIAEGKTQIPLEYDPKMVILSPKGGMKLKLTPL